MKITFLLHSFDNFGGVPRATANLTEALAAHHEVEIVSVFRTADRPSFPPADGVRVRYLVDRRGGPAAPKGAKPSRVMPAEDDWADRYTQDVDERILSFLGGCGSDVVIAARPTLAAYFLAHGRHGYGRVVVDHEGSAIPSQALREHVLALYREVDGVVCLTAADVDIYRGLLADRAPLLAAIPNIVPPPARHVPLRGVPLIVSAGQLVPRKDFATLINAFAQVAPRHPQWRLRIFGRGPERGRLQDLIHAQGLSDHVRLMGVQSDLAAEWDKAAFAAASTRRESFGLTLVEAMHHGLPVVSTNAPYGPGEIVVPGHNGLLVPVGDPDAMAQAMCHLIENPAEHERLAQGAYASAPLYSAQRVGPQYGAFLRQVVDSLPQGHQVTPSAESVGRGDALVRGDGAIEVRVALRPGAEPPTLCVRLRKAEDPLVRLAPFGSVVDEAVGEVLSTYVIPAEPPVLAEGRYDIEVELPDGRRQQLAIRGVHTGGLLVRQPSFASPAYWVFPYQTADGNLSLFVRNRAAHAEVQGVRVQPDGWHVSGRLVLPPGADPTGIRLTAVPRKSCAAGTATGGVSLGRDGSFAALLPFESVAAAASGAHDDWDLWLEEGQNLPRIRMGRFFDDILERKQVDVFPTQRWQHPLYGKMHSRVFFTPGNELSFTASPSTAS